MRTVVIVSGPSGVGKDTVITQARTMATDIQIGRSLTTRAPRADDTKYDYATVMEFHERYRRGDLLEKKEVYEGMWYGKLIPSSEGLWILEMDVEGAEAAKLKIPDALKVLIIPPRPWLKHLAERLASRNLSPKEMGARLRRAEYEINFGLDHDPDLVIENREARAAGEELARFAWQARDYPVA